MTVGTDLAPTPEVSLADDPVEHMAVALNRAKGWLAEAKSIEEVREQRALAVGYESVIREKELAFDAQLSATEIVRRCERRIGELVREGQRAGKVAHQGDNRHTLDVVDEPRLRVAEAMGARDRTDTVVRDSYALADAPAERFEAALAGAREEGNLSRANVVRKVKGEKPKPAKRSEWHRKRRHIDSNRILRSLAQEMDAATAGLELMQRHELDHEVVAECLASIEESIQTIHKHLRRIK